METCIVALAIEELAQASEPSGPVGHPRVRTLNSMSRTTLTDAELHVRAADIDHENVLCGRGRAGLPFWLSSGDSPRIPR